MTVLTGEEFGELVCDLIRTQLGNTCGYRDDGSCSQEGSDYCLNECPLGQMEGDE